MSKPINHMDVERGMVLYLYSFEYDFITEIFVNFVIKGYQINYTDLKGNNGICYQEEFLFKEEKDANIFLAARIKAKANELFKQAEKILKDSKNT